MMEAYMLPLGQSMEVASLQRIRPRPERMERIRSYFDLFRLGAEGEIWEPPQADLEGVTVLADDERGELLLMVISLEGIPRDLIAVLTGANLALERKCMRIWAANAEKAGAIPHNWLINIFDQVIERPLIVSQPLNLDSLSQEQVIKLGETCSDLCWAWLMQREG